MPWRGFVVESKSYMSYDGLSPRQKVWFWLLSLIDNLNAECAAQQSVRDFAYAAPGGCS